MIPRIDMDFVNDIGRQSDLGRILRACKKKALLRQGSSWTEKQRFNCWLSIRCVRADVAQCGRETFIRRNRAVDGLIHCAVQGLGVR